MIKPRRGDTQCPLAHPMSLGVSHIDMWTHGGLSSNKGRETRYAALHETEAGAVMNDSEVKHAPKVHPATKSMQKHLAARSESGMDSECAGKKQYASTTPFLHSSVVFCSLQSPSIPFFAAGKQ